MTEAGSVEKVIREFLDRSKKGEVEFARESSLYDDGIGLDSLAAAELSATLEDEFGRDPWSAGELPETVGDLIDFYA